MNSLPLAHACQQNCEKKIGLTNIKYNLSFTAKKLTKIVNTYCGIEAIVMLLTIPLVNPKIDIIIAYN